MVVEEDVRTRTNGKLEIYKKYVESLPEPSTERIEELKAAIENGTLVTPQAVRGAANQLTELFVNGKLPN